MCVYEGLVYTSTIVFINFRFCLSYFKDRQKCLYRANKEFISLHTCITSISYVHYEKSFDWYEQTIARLQIDMKRILIFLDDDCESDSKCVASLGCITTCAQDNHCAPGHEVCISKFNLSQAFCWLKAWDKLNKPSVGWRLCKNIWWPMVS